jgi:DNA-binding MarR family transcriptional regulator
MNKFEKVFGRNAQLVVLEYLIRTRGTTAYLSGIAEETGLSNSSVARVIEPLLKLDMVKERRVGKQLRTFTLNEDSEIILSVIRFYGDLEKIMEK